MLICHACQQENPEGARFCLACGTTLDVGSRPGDERRVVTVIFVDLVGFTARAERLDPEDVLAVLAPYHERVRREIESFGGVVEKFIGDAVMGLFGAPHAYGDDAERAVRAGLVVRDSVSELASGDLQIRIAVNTGDAVVSLGARPALGESMVTGDVVNTASRLQAAAPVNGIVVGEETYLETRDVIAYESTEAVVAKGKEYPVKAWIALRALTEAGERPLSTSVVVGRARETAILRALWERTDADRLPHLVSIFGPAGVGKSTVAAQFGRIAAEGGARVVRGRSLPYRESGPYGTVATHVMQLCGVFESDAAPVIADKLRKRVAELFARADADPDSTSQRHLGAIVGVDTGNDASDREALFDSTWQFFEAVARERPTILVFEDIHWANSSMLDLIETLARRIRGLPMLFVTLSRPELLDTRTDWGAGLSGYTALTLGAAQRAARAVSSASVRRLGESERVNDVVRGRRGEPPFHRAARCDDRRDCLGDASDQRPWPRRRTPGRSATTGANVAARRCCRRQGLLARSARRDESRQRRPTPSRSRSLERRDSRPP